MASERIPFGNAQESCEDVLGGASPVAMNITTDGKGVVKRRPGIGAYPGALSSVIDAHGFNGVYLTEGGDLYAVTPSPLGRIYIVNATAALDISAAPGAFLSGGGRPVFAETEALLVIAAGGTIQKVVLATRQSSPLGGDPPQASHVAANNSRIVANDMTVTRSGVRYSSIANGSTSYAGHEIWTPAVGNQAGFFYANARPDPVVALAENTNELFVFGADTLQVFDPDATMDFASGATREVGCGAPYSIVKSDQEFAWLDHRCRFVLSDGRSYSVLSDGIKQQLEEIARSAGVSDCFGFRVLMGSVDAQAFCFPADGRCFVIQKGYGWAQWSGWSDATDAWTPLLVTSSFIANGSNAHIVGTSDGRIGELSERYSTDFGARINAYIETGFLDRGTDARKQCVALRLALRRGQSTTEAHGRLSWRDNLGPWEAPIPVSLGASGDTDIVVEFRSLGVYRRRQWRFQFDGDADLALAGATEEYTVLGN
jgi:hypothetical protein